MPSMRKPPVRRYAPRGVEKRQIALRLLAPELKKHENLVEQRGTTSAALAREIYLLGLPVYESTAQRADHPDIADGVNHA